MAGLIDVGSIAAPGADFASTGPHLHVGVQDATGKYLDPETARSFLLNRILVGQNRTPITQQHPNGWQFDYTITSPFGHREAPTAGASTEHQGTDIAIPQGTKLAWLSNPGDTYTPNKGFGTIQTTDPQGKQYTVKLLHTTPGAAAQMPGGQVAPPGTPPSTATGNTYNFYISGTKTGESQDPSSFLNDYLANTMNVKSFFNPYQALQAASAVPTFS